MKNITTAHDWFLSVVSGQRKGVGASFARGFLSTGEPIYSTVIHARNFLYTRRILKAAHARRPVVSIGNITTGGTGKTPMVAWLVKELRTAGRVPAVLLRGYRSNRGSSDEELLLRNLVAPSPVEAKANRFIASEHVLAQHPEIDVFVLDDGLQHRQLARHFSLVLVDAMFPFGHGHVLPRGLLREPMRAFRRANAVVITRADLVDPAILDQIEQRIRIEQRDVPMFRCNFKQDRLLDSDGVAQPIEALRRQRMFAFCGIGNPDAFFQQLKIAGGDLVGSRRFEDHHHYTRAELLECISQAKTAGAAVVLTTEKDWVKIAPIASQLPADPPLLRVSISVEISNNDGPSLVKLAMAAIHHGDELMTPKLQS
jgi:tetraacyldisaccharide 4'-kinase